MKILTLIISFLILFLAVEPGMDLILGHNEATEHGCCGGVKDEQDSEKGHCSQKVCNPFQKCSSCTIVFFNTFYHFSHEVFNCSPCNSSYQTSFIKGFSSDFWQPPKQA